MTVAEIVSHAKISDVWAALGAPPLRHGRGRAWWREGEGYHVALSDTKCTWFDHARGEGGGVLDLIQRSRGCSRADALAWLADHLCIRIDEATPEKRRQWAREREQIAEAELWGRAAGALAEAVLEDCPLGERDAHTRIIRIVHVAGPALVEEVQAWRSAAPELTAAMIKAGANSDKRLRKALAALIAQWRSADVAAA